MAAIAALLVSCSDPDDLGIDLLPSSDLIEVKSVIDQNSIMSYIYRVDTLSTDETSRSMLGSLNDPLFGTTTINFTATFRIQEFPEFGVNPSPDSIMLYMYYRLFYGDTITPLHFKVYEMNQYLERDASFRQDVDLKSMASDQLLGEKFYTPKIRLDSTTADTFYQLIRIPLDLSLAEKLLAADSADMVQNDNVFLEYFKGLYIETEKQTSTGGSILYLEAVQTSKFRGSGIVLYYHNEEATANSDTLYPYVITPFSARVNSYSHDYTGTPFYNSLNTDVSSDSLIYLQAAGGLRSKIVIDELTNWKDSIIMRGTNDTLPYAINHAEIIFQVDTVITDVKKFPPPNQLLLTFIGRDGKEYLPADYGISPSLYGGVLNPKTYTYKFVVTQHMQHVMRGDAPNNAFYLSIANSDSRANRVVLKGSGSTTGIKFKVVYSRFNN